VLLSQTLLTPRLWIKGSTVLMKRCPLIPMTNAKLLNPRQSLRLFSLSNNPMTLLSSYRNNLNIVEITINNPLTPNAQSIK